MIPRLPLFIAAPLLSLFLIGLRGETIRVATFNVQNYLVMDRVVEGRWRPAYPKPEVEKAALREVIAAVNPDLLALQEIGPKPFLMELQRDLRAIGLDYPHAFLVEASDEERHVALLSRLPPSGIRSHVDLDFPYFGEREKIRRGLLEVVFEAGEERWSLFVVHLKSKWTERPDDPEALAKRTGEATAARNAMVEANDPESGALYLIVGDFNDTRDTAPLHRFLRRGDVTLSEAIPANDSRGHSWTHHWGRQDIYSRVDYLLASPAMKGKVVDGRGYLYDGPGHEIASDHRLIWADLSFGSEATVPGEPDGSADGERLTGLLESFRN